MILQSHACLGINMEKTVIQNDTCTLVFIEALFTIVKTWIQPERSSTDEWIQKTQYIYTVKC